MKITDEQKEILNGYLPWNVESRCFVVTPDGEHPIQTVFYINKLLESFGAESEDVGHFCLVILDHKGQKRVLASAELNYLHGGIGERYGTTIDFNGVRTNYDSFFEVVPRTLELAIKTDPVVSDILRPLIANFKKSYKDFIGCIDERTCVESTSNKFVQALGVLPSGGVLYMPIEADSFGPTGPGIAGPWDEWHKKNNDIKSYIELSSRKINGEKQWVLLAPNDGNNKGHFAIGNARVALSRLLEGYHDIIQASGHAKLKDIEFIEKFGGAREKDFSFLYESVRCPVDLPWLA